MGILRRVISIDEFLWELGLEGSECKKGGDKVQIPENNEGDEKQNGDGVKLRHGLVGSFEGLARSRD